MNMRLIFLIISFIALSILSTASSVDALGYGWGMYPAYSNTYHHGSSYGYAGPYSYHFVPGSFWGHYYNPGLYYETLTYADRNSLMSYEQRNLGMTYDFITQEGTLY